MSKLDLYDGECQQTPSHFSFSQERKIEICPICNGPVKLLWGRGVHTQELENLANSFRPKEKEKFPEDGTRTIVKHGEAFIGTNRVLPKSQNK